MVETMRLKNDELKFLYYLLQKIGIAITEKMKQNPKERLQVENLVHSKASELK